MTNNFTELNNTIVQSSEVAVGGSKASIPPKVIMFKWGGTDQKFRCQICDMSFVDGENFKEHMGKHKLERKDDEFQCSVCHKSFKSQRNLETHQKIHSGVKKFRCKYCHRNFSSEVNLQKHIVDHTDLLQCAVCGEKYLYEADLVYHMIKHSTVRAFKCEICGKQFKRKHLLKRHKLLHDDNNERKYKCVECGKSFMYRHVLKNHVRLIHSNKHIGIDCPICGKFLSCKNNLKKHLRTHSGVREIPCETCGKFFFDKQHLMEHMRSHSFERNFRCKTCGQTFKHSKSLTRHEKIHSKSETIYRISSFKKQLVPCKFCGTILKSNDEFEKHMFQVHTEYQCCEICGVYIRKSWTDKHIEYHQKKGDKMIKPITRYVNTSTMTDPMEIGQKAYSKTILAAAEYSNTIIGSRGIKVTVGNIAGDTTNHTQREMKFVNYVKNPKPSSDYVFENCLGERIDIHDTRISQYPSSQANCSHGNQTSHLPGNQTSSISHRGKEKPITVIEAGELVCYLYNSDVEKLNANTSQGIQTVLASEEQLLKFIQESCVDKKTTVLALTENLCSQPVMSQAGEVSFVPPQVSGDSFENSHQNVQTTSSGNSFRNSVKTEELSTAPSEFSASENDAKSQQLVLSARVVNTGENSFENLQKSLQLETIIATSTISMDNQNANFDIKNSPRFSVQDNNFIQIGPTSTESRKTKLDQSIPKLTSSVMVPQVHFGDETGESYQNVLEQEQNKNVNQNVESEEPTIINIPDNADSDATRSLLFQSLIDYAEKIIDQPSTN